MKTKLMRPLIATTALTIGVLLLPMIAHAGIITFGPEPTPAPELDPAFTMSALTLLGFGLAAVRGRGRRK